jgi:phosphate transport system substrate-binding protein
VSTQPRAEARRWRGGAIASLAVAVAAALLVAACGGSSSSGSSSQTKDPDLTTPQATLNGAGSTFDQPFFTRAFFVYHRANSNVTVNYASIGSGGGIAQFQANTVNFGATDVPMTQTELAAAKGGEVLQIPVTLGGVAISYNLPGVQSGLHLTGQVLSDIYMGKIKNWNDPAIKKLNPNTNLPDQAITVVHRSDGSGTSYIFTDYLSTVAPDWKSSVGTGKSVNWPVGVGGKGNEGVAGSVKQIPGSIGYVEQAYALQNKFTSANIQNKAGKWVSPTLDAVKADAGQKSNVSATDASIVNQGGAASYPISGYSWVLVYQKQPNAQTAEALSKTLNWLIHSGQDQAQAIQYVPLPANIQQLGQAQLAKVSDGSGKTYVKA